MNTNTLSKLLEMQSWVLGLIAATIIGIALCTFAVIGFVAGYLSNPIVGFMTTVCSGLFCLPAFIGLIVGAIHSKAKAMLSNLFGLNIPVGHETHEESLPATE